MTEDPADDIMRATYSALCRHGYADLTMQDIADESSKSKAALHYHYDSKADLLGAFLTYLYEEFEERVTDPGGDDHAERLLALVDSVLTPPPREHQQAFQTAILEVKAQAPFEPAYRDRVRKFDDLIHERVRRVVADGVDAGTFRADVDPDEVAAFFVTVLNGAHTRSVVAEEPPDVTRRTLADYVAGSLLAADERLASASADAREEVRR